jgi:hypothetical protein
MKAAVAKSNVNTRCPSAHRSTPEYLFLIAPKKPFHKFVIMKIGLRVPSRDFSFFNQRDDNIGVSVNATNSETKTANATVMPKE